MSLVPTGVLIEEAVQGARAVAAFNVITFEHAEAILAGAETVGVPVILQLSQNAVGFHFGRLSPIASAIAALASSSTTPASLHLDHVDNLELLMQAADCGFSSVMFDAGRLPYVDNVDQTSIAAGWAHRNGLWLEAELGYVGGKQGAPLSAHAPGVRTDPAQAAAFVGATGVDGLAVAVGSSHAMTSQTAALDDELIAALASAVPVPLVLHGSSGVPDAAISSAVRAGIVKVNIGTALNVAMTASIRKTLIADPDLSDPRKYLGPARDAIAAAVAHSARMVDGRPAVPSEQPLPS